MKVHIEDSNKDPNKDKKKENIRKRLNVNIDKIIQQTITSSIATHILNSLVIVYIDNKNHPNNYTSDICSHCGEQIAKNMLMEKYSWLIPTINNIEWEILVFIVNKQIYTKEKNSNRT